MKRGTVDENGLLPIQTEFISAIIRLQSPVCVYSGIPGTNCEYDPVPALFEEPEQS